MILWLAVLSLAALAAWNAARERRLLPARRWLPLTLLRAGGLALLALALWDLDPWGALRPRRPSLLAVVDASRSMGRRDRLDRSRYQRALEDVRKLAEGRRDLEVKALAGWEGGLGQPGEVAGGGFTDIGAWLSGAEKHLPDALVLLSDGNNNSGTDPVAAAAALGRPVHVLGYGPAQEAQPPAILDAWAPERAGLGAEAEIWARVKSGERPLALMAEAGGKRAGARRIPAGEERTEVFRIVPEEPGMHRVRLFLTDGDDTLDRRTVAFRAEKEKLEALCLCGKPDWNLRFLRQAAAADRALGLSAFVRRQGKWEAAGPETGAGALELSALGRADLIILMNMGPDDLGADLERAAIEAFRRRDRPLLFLGTGWDESFRGREIYHLLPLRVGKRGGKVQGRAEVEAGHLARLAPGAAGPEALAAAIRKLPPLRSAREVSAVSRSVNTVGAISAEGKMVPVWAWWYQGRAMAAQLAAEDLWLWGLAASGRDASGSDTSMYGRLIRGTLRWLAGMQGHAAEAGPERGFYHAGEEVRFRGRLRTPGPGEDAHAWRVTVSDDSGRSQSRAMARWGGGEYQAVFASLAQGRHQWRAELSAGGRVIDRSQGRFWVEPNAGEQGGHAQQAGLLKSLAEATGGGYWDMQEGPETQSWVGGIKASAAKAPGRSGPLALALSGLALIMAEWFWRRRWGLK